MLMVLKRIVSMMQTLIRQASYHEISLSFQRRNSFKKISENYITITCTHTIGCLQWLNLYIVHTSKKSLLWMKSLFGIYGLISLTKTVHQPQYRIFFPRNYLDDHRQIVSHHKQTKVYSKTCLKRPLKNRQNKGLKDRWYSLVQKVLVNGAYD